MSAVVIALGSTRKPKLAAVREAVDSLAGLLDPGATPDRRAAPDPGFEPSVEPSIEIDIVGVEVESGVNHTPLSREESMRGARQRAEALIEIARRELKPWKYFVGLEGGLDSVTENGGNAERHIFLESWAYVSDGTRGHFGRSGAVELPGPLADEVFNRGVDLSVAIDRFAGEAGIRDAQGAWGVLSANRITRQEAFRVALIAAFSPFFNRAAYKRSAAAG